MKLSHYRLIASIDNFWFAADCSCKKQPCRDALGKAGQSLCLATAARRRGTARPSTPPRNRGGAPTSERQVDFDFPTDRACERCGDTSIFYVETVLNRDVWLLPI